MAFFKTLAFNGLERLRKIRIPAEIRTQFLPQENLDDEFTTNHLTSILERLMEIICTCSYNFDSCICAWPPLWSSGQSSWLQIQRYRVPFPALPDFLGSSASTTGSTQPLSIIEELLEWKSRGSGSRKLRWTTVGIRCAGHATPSIRRSWH
jgi:hypothetical protein